MWRIRHLMVMVALVALAGAACASSSSNPTGAGTTSPAANAGGGGLYGGGPRSTSPPASSGAASATIQQGAGGQLAFSPATLTIKQGDVIEIDDVSAISHTFTIDGQGIDVVNEGGQSQTIAISLAPGTYSFICRFHVSSGMQGTLTVTG